MIPSLLMLFFTRTFHGLFFPPAIRPLFVTPSPFIFLPFGGHNILSDYTDLAFFPHFCSSPLGGDGV